MYSIFSGVRCSLSAPTASFRFVFVLVGLLLGSVAQGAPAVTATKVTDAPGVRSDVDKTITYTITITNGNATGVTDALGVVLTDATPANTALVAGSLTATPVAVADSYPNVVPANMGVNSALLTYSVVDNDFAGYAAGSAVATSSLTITTYAATSEQGGTVSMTTSGAGVGRFVYNAPAGFIGTDTFTYTMSNGVGTSTGTVSLTVSGPVVWFANAAAAAGGNGTLAKPFIALAAANAAAIVSTDRIFLYSGSYTGGITLANGVRLYGAGAAAASFDALTGVSCGVDVLARPAVNGVDPVIGTNGLSIANGASNTIAGVTVSPVTGPAIGMAVGATTFGTLTVTDVSIQGNGPALSLSSGTLAATFDSISVSSSPSTAVSLTGILGSLTINGGAITNTTGDDFVVNGGAATISYAGTITNTAGRSVSILNRTGGSVTFSGAISDTGTGISLTSNTGSAITFSGGLALSTGANAAFTASGGGTVVVTQNNTSIVNTLATTTGTALSIANTTIGASGVTFRSIATNGAINGIVLTTTGGAGGLTVTGDTGSANNGSGGTIRNTSGAGVLLTATSNVALDQLNLSSTGASGIDGTTVANFSYTNGTITGAGNGGFESAIAFNGRASGLGNNLVGTLTVTGSTFASPYYSGVDVQSDAGTVTNATISNNTFTTPGSFGVNIAGTGNAATVFSLQQATIANNTVTNAGGSGIQVSIGNANFNGPGSAAGVANDAGKVIAITGNSISVADAGAQAIGLGSTGANSVSRASANFRIQNNGTAASPLTGSDIGTVILIGNNGYSTMTGVVDNNVIDANHTAGGGAGNGIGGGNGVAGSGTAWTPDLTLAVTNNSIQRTDGNGILLVGRGTSGTAKFKIQNNTVGASLSGYRPGIRVDAGNFSSFDDAILLNISGNTSAGSGGAQGIGLRKQGTVATTNDFAIQGLTPSPATAAQMEAFVASQNTGGVYAINGSNFVTTGALPLLYAPGGIPAAIDLPVAPSAVSDAVLLQDAAVLTVASLPVAPAAMPSPVSGELTQSGLDEVVAQALARWESAGITTAQVARLRSLRFEVAALSDLHLGESSADLIRLSPDAGGHGWFIEADSASDSLFAVASTATRLCTDSTSAPAGRIDLLTAILHEMGHALGLGDSYAPADREGIMYGWLPQGERRLPAPGEASRATSLDRGVARFLSAPISIGTLGKGQSVVVTFQVTISARANISNTATVSGSNFTNLEATATTEVQQQPTLSGFAKSVDEDALLTFAAADFAGGFSDPNTGDTLASVTIVTVPAHGTLRSGATVLVPGSSVAAVSLGGLTYTPSSNYSGADSFLWNATDNSTVALSAANAAAVAITVNAVAETPTISGTTTLEDTQSGTGLVLTRAATDGDEVTHFKITVITGGTLYKNNGTTVIANNTFITYAEGQSGLKFTPAANDNDSAGGVFSFDAQAGTDAVGGGLGSAATASIAVTAVNDAPSITTADGAATEDVAGGLRTFSFSDLDAASASDEMAVTVSVASGTLAASSGGGVTVESGSGTGVLVLSGTLDALNAYVAGNGVLFTTASNDDQNVTATVTIDDGGASGVEPATGGTGTATSEAASRTFTIVVVPVNDAPTTNPAFGYINLGVPAPYGSLVTIANTRLREGDPDDSGTGVIYTVTTATAKGTLFRDANGNNVVDGGEPLGTTATFTQDDIDQSRIRYQHGSVAGATDHFVFSMADGGENGAAALSNLTFTFVVSNPPVVTTSGGATVFAEGNNAASAPVAIDGALTVVDSDSTTLASATVSITGNIAIGQDSLAFVNDGSTMGNIAADAYVAGTGILSLSSSGATATVAEWQAALRAVTYTNSSNTPGTLARTVSFVVTDGATASDASTKVVSVTATNDTPTGIALSGATVLQSVGTNAAVGTLLATDADDSSFTFTLVAGTGDTANASFNISGTTLRANNAGNLAGGTYAVRVQVDDGHPAGTYAQVLSITVTDDVAPATPSTPDLTNASDTGFSNTDDITTETTPTLTGTAEAGSTVELYEGASLLGSATATGGSWTITSAALGAGVHSITAKATDAANNTSSASTALSITIDTTAPTLDSIERHVPLTVNTSAATVTWRVAFDGGVTGVDVTDFALTTLVGMPAGTIAAVTPVSAEIYDVTVSAFSGQGRLRLDLKSTGTGIVDLAGNPIADGGFIAGDFYIVGVASVFDSLNLAPGTLRNVSGATANQVAQRFTTSGTAPLTLATATAALGPITGAPIPVVTLHADYAGAPAAAVLATLTNPASLQANALNVWTSSQLLTANTSYWIVFSDASVAGAFTVAESAATAGGLGNWLTSPADYVYFHGANHATGPQAGALQLAIGAVSAPRLVSILRVSPSSTPATADVLVFRIVFEDAVQHVDAGDFVVTGTTATVTAVTPVGGFAYDLTISGGDLAGLTGPVTLLFAETQDITSLGAMALVDLTPAVDNEYFIDVLNNDAPVLTPFAPVLPAMLSTDHDAGRTVASIVGTSITDVDPEAVQGIAIRAADSSYGVWQCSIDAGASWSDFGSTVGSGGLLLRAVDLIRFVPDGLRGDHATLTYVAWDQSDTTVGMEGLLYPVIKVGGRTPFSIGQDTVSLIVTPEVIGTYEDWLIANFTETERSQTAIVGMDQDPDGAGVTNLLRFAFDLPGRGPVSAPTTWTTVVEGGVTYQALQFNVRGVAPGLSYIVESSTDLVLWVPVSTWLPSSTTTVTARDSVALGIGARRFLRLRVTLH